MERIGHLLLAVDGSEGALAAAAMAGLLARNCNSRVSIVVVHGDALLLLPGVTEAALPGSMPFNAFPKDEARKHAEAAASEHIIPSAEAALGTVPGGVSSVQLWGHTAEKLCRYAEKNDVDMIIMGKRGGGTFKKLLLGSVALQVVGHAPCAVTVVG